MEQGDRAFSEKPDKNRWYAPGQARLYRSAPAPAGITPPSQTPSTPPRLLYLDGLRGGAALMVVLFHLWGSAGNPTLPVRVTPALTVDLLSPIGALGGSRVSLFFVLSGFVLYLPFARRRRAASASRETNRTPDPETTLAGWLWRRFRRLAPPYYAALALSLFPVAGTFYLNEAWRVWGQHLPPRVPDFGNLFAVFPSCLFFLHGMVPSCEAPSFNGALWTLTPEVQLYLAFPLLIGLTRCRARIGKWRVGGAGLTVSLALVASILYRVWLYRQIGYVVWREGGLLSSQYHCLVNTFLGRWAEFVLGMGAAELIVKERISSPRVLVPATFLCLGGFLILRSDLVIEGWIGQLFLAMEPSPSPLADAAGGLTFALLILCSAAVPRLARWLTHPALVRLGTLAYSLYLVHLPVVLCLHRGVLALYPYLGATDQGVKVFVLNLVLGLPLAFIAACGFWFLCERPFLSRHREQELRTCTV